MRFCLSETTPTKTRPGDRISLALAAGRLLIRIDGTVKDSTEAGTLHRNIALALVGRSTPIPPTSTARDPAPVKRKVSGAFLSTIEIESLLVQVSPEGAASEALNAPISVPPPPRIVALPVLKNKARLAVPGSSPLKPSTVLPETAIGPR